MNETTIEYASSLKEMIYLFIKRTFDIIAGLFGCLLLVPVTIIIKIVNICHGDFGSVFFTQDRIGKNGKLFKFYKYRSMIPNADKVLEELLANDEELAKEYKRNKKLNNDPRITAAGKIIRKYSIDELPQFINVLNGTMSLIGNRPYLPREIPDMGESYEEIVQTKPGITGYWQVSGRNDIPFYKRLQLESYYSRHHGFRMDTSIFFKTFKVVFFGRGAK